MGSESAVIVDAHIRSGEFEEAAEYLAEHQGAQWFDDTLLSRFGPYLLEGKVPCGAVVTLPRLARGPVITTNLDHVIEKAFESEAFEEKAWGARARLVAAALHSDQRYLLKLHGDVLDGADRILTLSEYHHHYGDTADGVDLSLPLPDVLKTAFTARTLLFLGCSLSVDQTMRLLERVISPSSPTHYAIVEQPADRAVALERAQFLSKHKIRPLWFPAGCFGAVELLVGALAKHVEDLSGTASRRSAFIEKLLLIPAALGAFIAASPLIKQMLSTWRVGVSTQLLGLFLVVLAVSGIARHRKWQREPGIPLERLRLSPSFANGVFGGLFGATIAGVIATYFYLRQPEVDSSEVSLTAIVGYCVMTAVVMGPAIQLGVLAFFGARLRKGAPFLFNEVTGGILGGVAGGVVSGIPGGIYFGSLDQPLINPGILWIGGIFGALAIAAGSLFFNYVGSLKRAIRIAAVAAVAVVVAVVAGWSGTLGLFGRGVGNVILLFFTKDPVRLGFAGGVVGAIIGTVMGLQVGLTLLLYRVLDERGP